jgi:hypothetical protein
MKLRNIAAAIVGLMLLAMASFAENTAKLEGTVKLNGKPLLGAVIKFERTDAKGSAQTKTDKKGHYIYIGLVSGSVYTISCEVDGKKVDERRNITASLTDPNNAMANDGVVVNFDLKQKQAESNGK